MIAKTRILEPKTGRRELRLMLRRSCLDAKRLRKAFGVRRFIAAFRSAFAVVRRRLVCIPETRSQAKGKP